MKELVWCLNANKALSLTPQFIVISAAPRALGKAKLS